MSHGGRVLFPVGRPGGGGGRDRRFPGAPTPPPVAVWLGCRHGGLLVRAELRTELRQSLRPSSPAAAGTRRPETGRSARSVTHSSKFMNCSQLFLLSLLNFFPFLHTLIESVLLRQEFISFPPSLLLFFQLVIQRSVFTREAFTLCFAVQSLTVSFSPPLNGGFCTQNFGQRLYNYNTYKVKWKGTQEVVHLPKTQRGGGRDRKAFELVPLALGRGKKVQGTSMLIKKCE